MENDQTLKAIRYQRGSLTILDQLKLPEQSVFISIETVADAWKAIHTMSIRGIEKRRSNHWIDQIFVLFSGAPAIAVCGVLSVAVELYNSRAKFDSIESVQQFVTDQLNYLVTARPTAVNMADAAKTITGYLIPLSEKQNDLSSYIDELLKFIEAFLERDLADNRAIGRFGAEAIVQQYPDQKKLTILTHCNTGSLATVGFGTALGVIRQLAANNLLQLAYFTETRPYNQGSRLTAYELIHDRIPHTMICDNMAGLLMRTQPVHAVVVGADRVTANGDTANKIGTYQLAILAKHHKIPFYIAAPTTSIDLTKKTGQEIVIEQRPASEMTSIKGVNIAADGNYIVFFYFSFSSWIFDVGVQVWNPSFDVTPADLITGIITEHGVFKPEELEGKLLALKKN